MLPRPPSIAERTTTTRTDLRGSGRNQSTTSACRTARCPFARHRSALWPRSQTPCLRGQITFHATPRKIREIASMSTSSTCDQLDMNYPVFVLTAL